MEDAWFLSLMLPAPPPTSLAYEKSLPASSIFSVGKKRVPEEKEEMDLFLSVEQQ